MNSVIKGASYILAHVPDMVLHNGATQTTERVVNPESDYLVRLPEYLRRYEEAVQYTPNQTYIGSMTPEELAACETPWYEHPNGGAERFGKFGEIMPQDEFYMLMQTCDVFELVRLEKSFVADVKARFIKHPLMDENITARVKDGAELPEIEALVANEHAEGLYQNGRLIGCVKKAHDLDENLSAHVIHENLVSKASCVLSLLHLAQNTGIDKNTVDLVIDCSEEACGDMNQRGGGNMAKAAAEIAGFSGATGADLRAFCAGPVHALIHAAALVASGTYQNVVIAGGGSSAKLGMNGKDHVKKNMPVLEDVLGGFAVLVGVNDGVNPEILCEFTGRHAVGSGSSPQAVMTALVADPLDRMGLKITDIHKYAAEMQNPDVTKPAGAGDVPLANFKMVAALAVKRGELERAGIDAFTREHGMTGWAPTQGHIPSGVPFIGFAREDILSGSLENCMLIGKGSLFLGRMTNLFDGVSVIVQKNSGSTAKKETAEPAVSEPEIKRLIAGALRDFARSLGAE